MTLVWWRFPASLSLVFPQNLAGVLLAVLYTVAIIFFLWRYQADFVHLHQRQWLLFVLSLLLMVPAHALLILYRNQMDFLPAYPANILPTPSTAPLLGLLLVAAVAAWLGPGPGLVAGLVAGLVRAWFYPLNLNDIFALAVWGGVVGVCLRQPYRGLLFNLLRRPVVVLPLATLASLLVLGVTRVVELIPPGGLLAVDYAFGTLRSDIILLLLVALGQGLVLELFFFFPGLRPAQRSDVVPGYSRSLRTRFLVTIIPLVLASVIGSVLAVTTRAISLARDQALAEMSRSAANAADGMAHFYYSGPSLLATFASSMNMADLAASRSQMEKYREAVPFFQELILVDSAGVVRESVPQRQTADKSLTPEEEIALQQALDFEISQVTPLSPLPSGEAYVTFVQPILSETSEIPQGVLLGRIQMHVNPETERVLEGLQFTRQTGTGFILDDRGLIIAHPKQESVLRPWNSNPEDAQYRYKVAVGTAYEDIDLEGERVLTYMRQVEGTPYMVVLQLPYATVLETATVISSPLLLVQAIIGAILLLVIPVLSQRITRPLDTLSQAAHRIAQGELGSPVRISGEDEVAQLGRAFEQMRLGLRARLNDLSLLLRVTQSVSATLDLEQGVLPVLSGALEQTGATIARFVLLGSGERIARVLSQGTEEPAFGSMDRAFATALARRRDPLVIPDLQRTGAGGLPSSRLRSVAAFPLRTKERTVAVLWVGAEEANLFDEVRINFLNTLAGEATVLVENVRHFQAAEGGRRRLAAILASTSDAILVTDQEGRLLLINPATQRLLGLDESCYGRAINELGLPASLETVLSRPEADQPAPPSVEVALDRRTFVASIAPIMTAEGQAMGRVAVLRDVTYFKELDEMKSDFVSTVSHDLRAPLTFMRGYATMLTMVGELNEKQHEYLNHILEGIEQMSALIGDLLNLRRIEAGVGIKQEPCRLGVVLVEAVDTMRARAAAKGITLGLERAEGSPTIIGDRTLLRQAIGNLVDNAIKYTAAGGQVRVGLEVASQEVIVRVADTGIGIAPEDQVRLFEKFYRVKRRETGEIPGTGLGLALVKSIVEHHGGRVWVESEMNKGTIFYIALPLPPEGKP